MRALVLVAVSLSVSVIATYVFGKVWFGLYMWHLGITNPAELSEDYGGAFFQLIAMVIVFVVCLISSPIVASRISKRFFGRTRP